MAARRVIAPAVFTRAAEPPDIAGLVRLLEQLGYPTDDEQLRARLEAGPAGRRVIVAELDEEIVGLAVLEFLHPFHKAAPEAVLTALVTEANARHRGVARALITDACRHARQAGSGKLYLRCDRRRDASHAFYRAQGFDETHLTFDLKL